MPLTLAPDATQHYFDFTYQPLTNEHGHVHGILAFAIEVTEQVLARQQVQRLNEALTASNEELHVGSTFTVTLPVSAPQL